MPEETPEEPVVKFNDLPDWHWSNKVIYKLVDRKIISGDAENNVRPDDNITREEAAKIITLAAKLPEGGDISSFTDSNEISAWAKDFVARSVLGGAFTGFPDGTFAPKANITREQFAAIVIRAFGFGEGTEELTFTDAAQITWAKGFVSKAVELGIVNGYEDNTFAPANAVSRAEAFAMLSRALDLNDALNAALNLDILETIKQEADKVDEEAGEETTTDKADVSKPTTTVQESEVTGDTDVNGDGVIDASDDINGDGTIDEKDVEEYKE